MDEIQGEQERPAGSVRRGLPRASGRVFRGVLSNGAVVEAREVLGGDIIKAQAMVGDVAGSVAMSMALASLTTTVDGERFAWEDLKDVPGADVQVILELGPGNEQSPAPPT